jgi:hypothetical protein
MLDLLDTTLKIHTNAMLAIADSMEIFHTKFVAIFILYLHTECHILANIPLVIPVKSKAK